MGFGPDGSVSFEAEVVAAPAPQHIAAAVARVSRPMLLPEPDASFEGRQLQFQTSLHAHGFKRVTTFHIISKLSTIRERAERTLSPGIRRSCIVSVGDGVFQAIR